MLIYCDVVLVRIVSGGVELSEGGSVIMDRPADEGGASEDEEQFLVQDSAPLELPETEAFLPITHDKPEGACVRVIDRNPSKWDVRRAKKNKPPKFQKLYC